MRPRRPRRLLRRLGTWIGRALVFLVALVVGVVVHLNTAAGRRTVCEEVNRLLATSFRGHVVVTKIDGVGWRGVTGADVTIDDPAGQRVLTAHGIRAGLATLAALRSALLGKKDPVTVDLTGVAVDELDVVLDPDAEGTLTLLDALAPPVSSAPAGPPGRGVDLTVYDVTLRHARAHGSVRGAPPLDVDVDDLRASLSVAPGVFEGDVAGAHVTAHRIANGADVDGFLTAHVRLPSASAADLEGRVGWDGKVGGIVQSVRASYAARRLDATVDVPRTTPEDIRALWTASPVQAPATVHAEAHGSLRDVAVVLHAAVGAGTLDVNGHVSVLGARSASLDLAARDVDLHELAPSAPASKLGLTGHVSGALAADGAGHAEAALQFGGGRLGGQELPPVRLAVGGDLDLSSRRIHANASADATSIAGGGTRVGKVALQASMAGSLDRPTVAATLLAHDLAVAGRRFRSADLQVSGDLAAARVKLQTRGPDTPDLDATLVAGLVGSTVSLRDVRAVLARGGERAVVTTHAVRLQGSQVRVEGARVEGLGEPVSASVEWSPRTLVATVATRGIDLARVGRLAHVEDRLAAGTLTVDASVRTGHGDDRGRITLDLSHVDTGPTRNVTAHVEGSLHGRTLEGTAHLDAAGAGTVDLRASKVLLGGPQLLSAASWARAKGAVDVDARVDLARVVSLVPAGQISVTDAAGTVHLEAHLRRDDSHAPAPAITLKLTTDRLMISPGFQVVRDIDGVLVHPASAWRLAGVDFDVDASVSGAGAARVSVQAHDARGPLARLDVGSPLSLYALASGGNGPLLRELRTTPFDVHLSIPERGLGTLPPILTQSYASGRLKADLTLRGTMAAPALDFTATVAHARVWTAMSRSLDVDVRGKYDGVRATVSVHARTRDKEVLDLEGLVDGALAGLVDGRGPETPWTASATAHAEAFPLGSIALLGDKGIAGDVSGDVKLEDLHRSGRAEVGLTIDRLVVGSVAYQGARLTAHADGHVLDASVQVDQSDGLLRATAHGAESWGAAITPALDRSQPLQATLSSKNFRIAGLLPFVDSTLDELDGRLDADARLELDPRARTAKGSGTLKLRRGTIEAVAGGGELHDLSADVTVAPDGTVTLQKLTASGVTGHLEATGVAHLQGTSLRSAHAVVTIPSGAAIPVTAGGIEVGSVDGRIEATVGATEAGRAIAVKVEVPQLDVKLPEGSTTNPQALGPMDARIRIGAHRGDPARFVLLPLDPILAKTPAAGDSAPLLDVQTHLARVHVVRGTQLAVNLTGQVDAAAGAKTRVTGQIRLHRGGTLAVQGRTFVVESGTVTFVGNDPSNPQVVVKADWTSPDATVVTATFTGALKTGKVTLASEPQLPRDEIVQLLLFGSADGTQAQTPSSSTENSAIATAGGQAAQPLNHMLDQLGLGAVTANVDSSDAANPKPEVEVQIARDISVQLAVVLGQPPPGVNPDVTLLTLDWRFLSKWSLATTVGNAGTTIFDLLWQKRY